MSSWFIAPWEALAAVALSAVLLYPAVILLTRWAGLRSFSKMSGFDFAMTVAIGSVVASSILTDSPPLAQALTGLAAIYALQIGAAALRTRWTAVSRLIDNEPLVLMTQDGMVEANLRRARVTENDIWAKLHEANVITR